jgi:hypothetical protein
MFRRNAHDFSIVQKSFVASGKFVDKGVVGGGKIVNPMCIQTRVIVLVFYITVCNSYLQIWYWHITFALCWSG